MKAISNNVENITRNTRICRLHWPSNEILMVRIKRFTRPKDPPTVFVSSTSTMERCKSSKSRDIYSRKIALEVRGTISDEIEMFEARDCICSFEDLKNNVGDKLTDDEILFKVADDCIHVFYLINEDYIQFSIKIDKSMNVSVKSFGNILNIHDLLGFQRHLERWSQLEAIINRAKNHLTPYADKVKYFIQQHEHCTENDQIHFLIEQLYLSTINTNYHYSTTTMKIAIELYLSSRATYGILRQILNLPHPDILKKKLGSLNGICSADDARNRPTINAIFNKLEGLQRVCFIIFDEIYVKPSIRLRGNHLIGYSEDEPSRPARTVLTFMIRPLMGGKSSVVRLIPIFSLKADFLYEQLISLLRLISECGGRAIALMCDCHAINRKCYKMFNEKFLCEPNMPWKVNHPTEKDAYLFLLFDTTHLMKNIRNNWITESRKELSFRSPESEREVLGEWNDVVDLYSAECDNVIKMTPLTLSSCFPSSIQQQNLPLVLKVFSEKVIAALILKGKVDTAVFIGSILRMWKILNVKAPDLHIRLNDRDREQITTKNHVGLTYLRKIAKAFSEMPGGRGSARTKSFTTDTRSRCFSANP